MSNPLFVDTGYVIALINENDQHHQEALALADKYEKATLITTDAILLEIGNALSRIAREEAIAIIHYFQLRSCTKKTRSQNERLKRLLGEDFRICCS